MYDYTSKLVSFSVLDFGLVSVFNVVISSFSTLLVVPISDHVSFIKDVAICEPPEHLSQLLRMLKTRGGSLLEFSLTVT